MLKILKQNWARHGAVHSYALLILVSAVVVAAARVPGWLTGLLPSLLGSSAVALALNQGNGIASLSMAINMMGTVVQGLAGNPPSPFNVFVAVAGGALFGRLLSILLANTLRHHIYNCEMLIAQLASVGIATLYTIMYLRHSLWINIGGISVQLSEPLKLLFVIQVAGLASAAGSVKQRFFSVAIIAGANFILLAGLSELATAIILFITALAMIWLICPVVWAVATTIIAFAGGGVISSASLWLANHPELPLPGWVATLAAKIAGRLQIWLAPETLDSLGSGYQMERAAEALLTGSSLGTTAAVRVPVGDSDYIVVTMVGNFGVILTIMIIGAFVAFYYLLGCECFGCAHWRFSAYTAALSYMILVISSLLPAAGSVGLIPLGGAPIPFFSAGGSALFTNCGLVSLLLRQSFHARAEEEETRFVRRGQARNTNSETEREVQ